MGFGTSNFDCETIKSEEKKMYFNINDNNKKKIGKRIKSKRFKKKNKTSLTLPEI